MRALRIAVRCKNGRKSGYVWRSWVGGNSKCNDTSQWPPLHTSSMHQLNGPRLRRKHVNEPHVEWSPKPSWKCHEWQWEYLWHQWSVSIRSQSPASKQTWAITAAIPNPFPSNRWHISNDDCQEMIIITGRLSEMLCAALWTIPVTVQNDNHPHLSTAECLAYTSIPPLRTHFLLTSTVCPWFARILSRLDSASTSNWNRCLSFSSTMRRTSASVHCWRPCCCSTSSTYR